jgi:putative transposase
MHVAHRQHKALNNRAENLQQPTRRRERIMKRFTSARHLKRFVSIHHPIASLFHVQRDGMTATDDRALRTEAISVWADKVAAA